MKNGDMRYNLLEAVHRRRRRLRKLFMLREIQNGEYQDRIARLERWFNYRLAKLSA